MLLIDDFGQAVERLNAVRLAIDRGTQVGGRRRKPTAPLLGYPEQLLDRRIVGGQPFGLVQVLQRVVEPPIANRQQSTISPSRGLHGNDVNRLGERLLGHLRLLGVDGRQPD